MYTTVASVYDQTPLFDPTEDGADVQTITRMIVEDSSWVDWQVPRLAGDPVDGPIFAAVTDETAARTLELIGSGGAALSVPPHVGELAVEMVDGGTVPEWDEEGGCLVARDGVWRMGARVRVTGVYGYAAVPANVAAITRDRTSGRYIRSFALRHADRLPALDETVQTGIARLRRRRAAGFYI